MSTFCAYFDRGQCRSCDWITLEYSEQIERKQRRVRESLAFFDRFELEPTVSSARQGFRNRAKMAVTGTVEAPTIGLTGDLHQQQPLDEGRELLSCPIHHPRLNELMAALPSFITTYRLIPYQIESRRGELKGLIAFFSPQSRELYLRFVLRSRECVSRLRKMLPELQSQFPDLVCVSANLQPVPHALLEGPEEIFLTERQTILHQLGHLPLRLSPQAFVQTNVETALQLYSTAAEWILEAQPERAMELYCGQGAFTFFAARHARSWLSIELHPDAVSTARATATELGLSHLQFRSADATQIQPELAAFAPDLVLVNPPRRGLGTAVQLLLQQQPQSLLYSSCNIESLAADLRAFASLYAIRRVRIFDLFPHTAHFETLVWLEKKRL